MVVAVGAVPVVGENKNVKRGMYEDVGRGRGQMTTEIGCASAVGVAPGHIAPLVLPLPQLMQSGDVKNSDVPEVELAGSHTVHESVKEEQAAGKT